MKNIIIFLLVLFPFTVSASTLRQFYNDLAQINQDLPVYHAPDGSMTGKWFSQTFTPSSDYALTDFKVYGSGRFSPTGVVNIRLRSVDENGFPTGSNLAFLQVNVNTLSTSDAWNTFTFPTPHIVCSGTTYTLTIEKPTGTGNFTWRSDAVSPQFSGGAMYESINEGQSYFLQMEGTHQDDGMFEIWGENASCDFPNPTPPSPPPPSPCASTSAVITAQISVLQQIITMIQGIITSLQSI